MRSRDRQTRPHIHQDQLPDYEFASESLRRANFDAAQLVIALVHMHADAQQCRYLSGALRALVGQMKSLVDACERIVSDGSESRVSRVEFVAVPPAPCKSCVNTPVTDSEGTAEAGQPHQEQEHEEEKEDLADPSWEKEVEVLLRLSRRAMQWVTESAALGTRSAGELIQCLSSLTKVLSRQQRLVRLMGNTPTQSAFRFDPYCPRCGEVWVDPSAPDVHPDGDLTQQRKG